MRRFKILVLVGMMVVLSGCQWAKFNEHWFGPSTKANASMGVDAARARGMEFVPVGEGEWRDRAGKFHKETVYALRRSPKGPKGPMGVAGCVMAMAKPEPRVKVAPRADDNSFDANSGSYKREILVVSPPWGDAPGKTLSNIEPFKAKKVPGTPSFKSRNFRVGEGERGSFIGGDMETWQDAVRSGPVVLMIMGGLALLAGVVIAVWAGRIVLGIAVAGAGLALIATAVLFEMYPWVVLVALAAVLGLAIWWFIDAKGLVKTRTTLRAVVAGVQSAEAPVAEAVKAAVAKVAAEKGVETVVRSTVDKVKAGV